MHVLACRVAQKPSYEPIELFQQIVLKCIIACQLDYII